MYRLASTKSRVVSITDDWFSATSPPTSRMPISTMQWHTCPMVNMSSPRGAQSNPNDAAMRNMAPSRMTQKKLLTEANDLCPSSGTSARSVPRWLNAYLDRRLDGLRPRKARGAEPKLTPDLAPVLRQWVIDGPAKHGLDRANWTYAELAEHLYQTRGVRVGKSALQAFGAKHGIRPYRPTYRFLRGDPAKQRVAKNEIADLKKRRRPASSSC